MIRCDNATNWPKQRYRNLAMRIEGAAQWQFMI